MLTLRAGGGFGAGKPRAGGGITLRLLIEEGILSPGENVLTVEYKSQMTYATLMPDGRIACSVSRHPWMPYHSATPGGLVLMVYRLLLGLQPPLTYYLTVAGAISF